MPARAIRFVILGLIRLFYPRVEVVGREHLPAAGPVVVVANHPNGLLDPLLLLAHLRRPLPFLTAGYILDYPGFRQAAAAFGALPVYRKGELGGAPDEILAARNEATFTRARAGLRSGGALALFPEGTTHSGPRMLPIRSGAARIVLGAEAEAGWQLGLQIVPAGLWYENKTLFRSSVLIVLGPPIPLAPYAEAYAPRPHHTLRAVSKAIRAGLDAVVLQAETVEVQRGMPLVAAWADPAGPPATFAERHRRAVALVAAAERLAAADPARLDALRRETLAYARLLRRAGVDDPWALERPPAPSWRIVKRAALLLAALPAASAGAAVSYLPYRLAGLIAPRIARGDATQIGHTKLIGGSILVCAGWLAVAIAAGRRWGRRVGSALLVAQPILAYVGLLWGESFARLRAILHLRRIRRHRALTRRLVARRRALAAHVVAAAEAAAPPR